jgi:aflatoxin B1 aldehyde reductase
MEIILGTLNFKTLDDTTTESIVDTYISTQRHRGQTTRLDTARFYENEPSLSRFCSDTMLLTTKASPWPNQDFSKRDQGGGLAPAQLAAQLEASCRDMNVTSIHRFLLHGWDSIWTRDPRTLRHSLETCDTLWRHERFVDFGVCNFDPSQFQTFLDELEHVSVPMTTYQGLYNALCREVEKDIIPMLRDHGMRFEAYNPLCGGLLTAGRGGTHRYASNPIYRAMYFDVQDLAKAGMSMSARDALGWVSRYSKLEGGDGIILGASRATHIVDNIDAIDDATLTPTTLDTIDRLYSAARHVAPTGFW